MKPIQIMMDEDLLKRLDADREVKRHGRSAVLRRMVAEYVRARRAARTDAAYRRAYAGDAGLGDEFSNWDQEGIWPET